MSTADQAAAELYAAPLDEFIARRGDWVRRLRGDGDREAAEQVRKLPKPSVAAWAVNQLARTRPDDVRELLSAGERLRQVQEWLLRREADPHDLRAAVEAERDAVGRLTHAAAELLERAGRRASPQLLERIAETLHAAAADEAVAEQLRRGVLVQDRSAVGLGLGEVLAQPQVTRREPEAAKEERAQAVAEAEAESRAAAARQKDAEREAKRARAGLVAAEGNLADAEAALDRARDQLAEAERGVVEAAAAAEAAGRRAKELRRGS